MDNLFIRRAAGGEEPGGRQFQNSNDVMGDMRRALEAEEAAAGRLTSCAAAPEEGAQGPFASGKDTFFGRGVFPQHASAGRDGLHPGEGQNCR